MQRHHLSVLIAEQHAGTSSLNKVKTPSTKLPENAEPAKRQAVVFNAMPLNNGIILSEPDE